jgi:hypothetical protein
LDAPEEGNVAFRDFFWESEVPVEGVSDGAWSVVLPVDLCRIV